MIRTQQIRLRGTRYYEAPALYRSGELRAGRKVLLEHQPYNPHDRFAVAVMLADTHAMLGHIPREWAPMYAQRLQRKEIRDAYLVGASPRHDTVDVRIGVTYSISEEIPTEQPPCVVNQPPTYTAPLDRVEPTKPKNAPIPLGCIIALVVFIVLLIAYPTTTISVAIFTCWVLFVIVGANRR